MTPVWHLLECRRTAKRLQRFLDRDPSAPLSDEDRRRVQEHLAECERCSALSAEYEALHQSLRHLGASMAPDPSAVDRVRLAAERALEADRG